MEKLLYFLPGRREGLNEHLGQLFVDLGYEVSGREIISSFATLRFAEQLALIRSDLQPAFWHRDAVLIGRSYGAYLLLHALADMNPFPGRVLLCSPVLGAAVAKNGFFGSRPPRAERLIELAERNEFPTPRYLEIHTGAEDNGCDPALALRFANAVENTKLHVITGVGHQLTEEYLQLAIASFLNEEAVTGRFSLECPTNFSLS